MDGDIDEQLVLRGHPDTDLQKIRCGSRVLIGLSQL